MAADDPNPGDMDELARQIASLAARREGMLVAVCVSCPPSMEPAPAEQLLRGSLGRYGLGHVQVQAVAGSGPLRVIVAEFSR